MPNDLSICIKDTGPFYSLDSSKSFVPDQYLYSSINCSTHRSISFTNRPNDFNIDSASKFGLFLKN